MHGLQTFNLGPELFFLLLPKIERRKVAVVDHCFELMNLDHMVKDQPFIELIVWNIFNALDSRTVCEPTDKMPAVLLFRFR